MSSFGIKNGAEHSRRMFFLWERRLPACFLHGGAGIRLLGGKRRTTLSGNWCRNVFGVEISQQQFFGVTEEENAIDAEIQIQDPNTAPLGTASVRDLVRILADEFANKLDTEKRLNIELQMKIQDKDRQLKLLPDLQKQAEQERQAAEVRALEVEALKKQIAALEEQRL